MNLGSAGSRGTSWTPKIAVGGGYESCGGAKNTNPSEYLTRRHTYGYTDAA